MATLAFPIAKQPNPDNTWTWQSEDNTIRSTTDDGYVISRQRYTRSRDELELTWDLSDTEANTLQTFYKTTTANGSLEFILSLITPHLTITKTVLFIAPPVHTYKGNGKFESSCKFREV